MRKILALVLVLTIAVVFAACGDKGDEQTTLNPLNTSYNPASTGNNAVGATYILTTNQSKTAPALSTTRFDPNTTATAAPGQQNVTTSSNLDNLQYSTSGVITAPSVTTTRAITTTWATLPPTTAPTTIPVTPATTTTKATTTTTTQAPTTTEAQPEGVYVVINDYGVDTSDRIYAAIDSEDWGGKIKANSQRIPVYIDGVELEGGAMLQISSSTDGGGNQYVYLNLGDYEIDTDSSTVTFYIPEGFLENKTGTKYNYECEVSV